MAFSYTVTKQISAGDLYCVIGTYTNSTAQDTGGAIATGLGEVFFFSTNYGTSAATTVNKITKSYGTVTILTVANEDGTWEAWGV